MKYTVQVMILIVISNNAKAQLSGAAPWQLDLSTGYQSIYAPVKNLRWQNPEMVYQAAVHRTMGIKQQFALGLQIGLTTKRYQGNAVYVQLIGQYNPVIAEKIELGIGTGIGYRLGGYPDAPLKWKGSGWVPGKKVNGMIQVPLQVSIGYRSFHLRHTAIRPYAAVQLQSVLGYSPDLSFLPYSNIILGLKIQNHEK